MGTRLEPVTGDAARLVRDRLGYRGLALVKEGLSWREVRLRAMHASPVELAPDHEPVPLEVLQQLYRQWPFFRTVLSNMAQVLAKSDMGLAAHYSELVEDEELRRRVFDKILDEHQRTIRMHKLITGQDDLLADNPSLARSVFNRFPYLEPLNHLQVELLRRYRSGDDDELVQRGILLTMSGLATALRNSPVLKPVTTAITNPR